ncbi:hypothetical protein WH96_01180 [Kiloniella spongiae]|uniref:GIY-YIG domain-containing protein n=1 Tax=Kiloniella spongiae TaxID=1489064 RepID=A0A0H2MJ09_9PROT|nr:GIY-YIG nuclease family protein [Kiloniella spongiae]KLN62176.1 hypothetical protein WH96_01180 [Kiloniella spongiae]
MHLFDFISVSFPQATPDTTKLHLAVRDNYGQDPLDIYLAGGFEKWQSWQSKRNFNREHIVSLIQLTETNSWLFAGAYRSVSCIWNTDHFDYKTQPIEQLNEYSGRLKIDFNRPGRQSYLKAERWVDSLCLKEMLPKKMTVREFSGYSTTKLSKAHLDIIIQQQINSWYSSLSNVSGVYLITDLKTGKLYVGSATGEEGIWQRWTDYSKNGHGTNTDLIKILNDHGSDYASNFQYTILEIADTHMTSKEIKNRETYWKEVLGSREFGYNAN